MHSSHGIPSCLCLLIAAERCNASPILFPFFFTAFSNILFLENGLLEAACLSKILLLMCVVLNKSVSVEQQIHLLGVWNQILEEHLQSCVRLDALNSCVALL